MDSKFSRDKDFIDFSKLIAMSMSSLMPWPKIKPHNEW